MLVNPFWFTIGLVIVNYTNKKIVGPTRVVFTDTKQCLQDIFFGNVSSYHVWELTWRNLIFNYHSKLAFKIHMKSLKYYLSKIYVLIISNSFTKPGLIEPLLLYRNGGFNCHKWLICWFRTKLLNHVHLNCIKPTITNLKGLTDCLIDWHSNITRPVAKWTYTWTKRLDVKP